MKFTGSMEPHSNILGITGGLSIIRKAIVQEKEVFEGRKVSDHIVSIDRHYVHPIARGKKTKSIEFGARVNDIQIDGISFIGHLSFKAFNERTISICSRNP